MSSEIYVFEHLSCTKTPTVKYLNPFILFASFFLSSLEDDMS
jgi:hypothetical protein